MPILILIVAVALIAYFFIKIYPKIKIPQLGSLVMVNGGVKTGKTTLSVYLACQMYKRAIFRWKVKCFFLKLFKKPLPEEPHLYSNIPLKGVPFILLTAELIERVKRFTYKSIVYLDEASLVADKMLYKWATAEDNLTKFCKLIAHETRGGMLIFDTQSIGDLSIAIRRNISSYLYIHHLEKRIPFILLANVREERYAEDNMSVSNVYNEDVEDSMKYIIIPKRVWKMFDCYCYSKLTDHLETVEEVQEVPQDLRTDYIINLKEKNNAK